MNRPPVNGLNVELMRGIAESMDELSSDESVRGVILKSVNLALVFWRETRVHTGP